MVFQNEQSEVKNLIDYERIGSLLKRPFTTVQGDVATSHQYDALFYFGIIIDCVIFTKT